MFDLRILTRSYALALISVLIVLCPFCLSEIRASPLSQSPEISSAANQLAETLSTQEWLGPIAAIALSPFFGLTCLSGLATYGPDWARSHSHLLAETSPMNNPYLFWSMLVLTVLTSAPRFLKIIKPIALLAENLETYSAIIILVVMRFSISMHSHSDASSVSSSESITTATLFVAGIGEIGNDVMFSLAAAINLIVINTIKLAFEFVVWLIPVPLIDSIAEAANKMACLSLALLYAYSPGLSLLLNGLMFVFCVLIFLQVTRYLRYVKYLYLYAAVRSSIGIDEGKEKTFSAFTSARFKGIPAKSEWKMVRLEHHKFEVSYETWLTTHKLGIAHGYPAEPGILVDRIRLALEGKEIEVEIRKGTCPELKLAKQPLVVSNA